MTSGTTSPTPNDSPALLQRPLLTSREIGLRSIRKTVEFEAIYKGDEDAIQINQKWDQENYRSVLGEKNQKELGGRLFQPRMSLLGKPLNYRASRRDARYRKLQSRVYNFLERPRGVAFIYHFLVFILVFTGLALSVFSTIEEYEKQAGDVLVYMESIVCTTFFFELVLRTWSSGCRSRYQGLMGRLKFLRRPFCIIASSSYSTFIQDSEDNRGLVFDWPFRITWENQPCCIPFYEYLHCDHRLLLTISLFFHVSVLIITVCKAFLIEHVEYYLWLSTFSMYFILDLFNPRLIRSTRESSDVITIAASIVVLALTMKSGGQVLAASALRGLRFFQILRMVRMDRRGGTWKLLGSVVYAHRQELMTTLYIGFLGLIFASFLVFLAEKDVPNTKFNNFAQALWWGVITLCTVGYGDMVPFTWQGKIIASFCSLLGISFFALPAGILGSGFALKVQQQQRQKHMIRRRQPAATLIQSLWRCYAADEKSMSEATWKIHQIPYSPPVRSASSFRHNASFVGRLSTIRRHRSQAGTSSLPSPALIHPKNLTRVNSSADYVGNSSNGTRNNLNASYIEDTVASNETRVNVDQSQDILDEDEEPQLLQLTPQHKAAIRAIRKIKYFVARRKFREALKPYDVKDVIEQYSSGHADLLNRVKNLQYRLDQILGKQGSKSKDVYASKICLASRVVKVERQVDDIYSKLEQFFELYMEDRKSFLPKAAQQHVAIPVAECDNFKGSNQVTSKSETTLINHWTSGMQPKSILVEKQPSDPNLPCFREMGSTSSVTSVLRRPGLHRGFSDGGARSKKRVTLSSPCSYSDAGYSNSASPVDDNGIVTLIVPQIETRAQLCVPSNESPQCSQSLSVVIEPSTSGLCTEEQSSDNEDFKPENNEEFTTSQKSEQDEEVEDNDEEINETTLLCPTSTQSEIIISPSTLNCTSKIDVVTEDIYMANFKSPLNKRFRDY